MNLSSQVKKITESRNILFIYHRLDVIGGIETRWMDEFEYLNKKQYKIFFLAPKNNCKDEVSNLLSLHKLIKVDINNINLAPDFIKLVDEIISTIRTNAIDVISIHMLDNFSCAAVMAAQICRIPVISTVHGVTDVYRKPIQRLLVQELASKSFSLSLSVSQLSKNIFQTPISLSAVVPNLINLEKYQCQPVATKPTWLIVSRLSSEKFPSILRFLKAADACQIPAVDIAGGGNKSKLQKLINELDSKITINFLGQVENIAALIPEYSGIAGMGRVAIEGLACQKPVCILSPEGSLIGLVTNNNFKILKDYNFIGKTLAPIDDQKFFKQLTSSTIEDRQNIYSQLESELSIDNWPKYIELYKQVEFRDNQALESLYHKISHFSVTLSDPFIHDKFFQQLFYETLIEHNLKNIIKLWEFYEINHGLSTNYPNPFKVQKNNKKRWWYIFK